MTAINIFQGDICVAYETSVADVIRSIFKGLGERPYFITSDLSTYLTVQYQDLSIEECVDLMSAVFDADLEVKGFSNRIVFDQQARKPLLVDPVTRKPYEQKEQTQEA